MTPAIEVRNLSYCYAKGTTQQVTAVDNVSLSIPRGELVGIIGHTGSGKSTLISHFNGLLKPTEGEVLVDGEDIWKDKETLRKSRFRVGLCFQYPEYQLFEETVFKDIAFGPSNMKLDKEEINRRVLRAAEFTGLPAELLEKSPFDLSGGEKRRAAIAGVMAMQPQVLVLDEPASGLDPAGRRDLLDMIAAYRAETDSTVILVSHNMEDIARIADRVIVIDDGKVAMNGTVDEVFSRCEELRKMGLNVPEITQVFFRLRELGYDVPADVYSVDRAYEVISSLAERRDG